MKKLHDTNNVGGNGAPFRMPLAALILALNETLLLLLIAFGDWKMRLALLAMILISRCRRM